MKEIVLNCVVFIYLPPKFKQINMKTLKFFLFVATIFTLSACSSDDDNGPAQAELTTANIAGSYEILYYAGNGETSATAQGATVIIETETYSGDTFTNATATFNNDGTYELSGSFRETSTSTVTGQAPVTETEIITLTETGNYSVNNTSRTITLDGEVYDVLNFNGSNLNIMLSNTETDQGFTYTDNFELRMVKM